MFLLVLGLSFKKKPTSAFTQVILITSEIWEYKQLNTNEFEELDETGKFLEKW
jgi:hypothetical protein